MDTIISNASIATADQNEGEEASSGSRSITMYNVGFGDHFLINDGDDCLVVDYGAKKRINLRNESAFKNNSPKKCMLTHFHEDHYLGYQQMISSKLTSRFSDIYLPNIYSKETLVSFTVLTIMVEAQTSDAWKNAIFKIKALVDFFKLLDPKGQIHFIKESSSFTIGKTSYEVYAPMDGLEYDTTWLESYSRIKSKINPIIERIRELYGFCFADQYFNDTQKCYSVSKEDLNNQHVEEMTRGILESIGEVEFSNEEKKIIKENLIKYDPNQESIVFASTEKKLIMTGDMPKDIWESIKDEFNGHEVVLFKVPHHGTERYFSDDFPNAEYFLISNGKYSDWLIDCKYCLKYPNTKLLCTNNDGCRFYICHSKHCDNQGQKTCNPPITISF